MEQFQNDKLRRKIHYQALVIRILKAVKTFEEDEQIKEVLEECIDIADKLGDGYRLIDLNSFNTDSAPKCFIAIQQLKEYGEVRENGRRK